VVSVKGKDDNGESVLCGRSYEESQAVCEQGTISDPDTEGQVKGNRSTVRRHNVSYARLVRGKMNMWDREIV